MKLEKWSEQEEKISKGKDLLGILISAHPPTGQPLHARSDQALFISLLCISDVCAYSMTSTHEKPVCSRN